MVNYSRSDEINELVKSLVKAQSSMGSAAKDATNPHFGSRYADLAACFDACKPTLTENGLAILQPASADGPKITVTTMLAHVSGQWIACDLTLTSDKNTPQALGSCLTYARRYGLSSLIGLAADDDDGNEASAPKGSRKAQEDVASRKIAEMSQPAPEKSAIKSDDMIKAFEEMQGTLGEELYRDCLRQHGFTYAREITDKAMAREIYKHMGEVRKVVQAATHGELIKGINETIFLNLPETSLAAVQNEYKRKLIGLMGSDAGLTEFEAIRAKSANSWVFCNNLQIAITKLAKQQGIA